MVNTDSLRRLSMWIRGKNMDMDVPLSLGNPEAAADEIEALRADLMALVAAARGVIAVGGIPHSNQLQTLLEVLRDA